MNRIIALSIFLLITLPGDRESKAQVGITALPFLELNTDARSIGLAGSDVARKNRNGIHLNPAALGTRNSIQVRSPFTNESGYPFFSTHWLPSFNINDMYIASPSVVIGFEKLVAGYQFTRLNLGEQVYTDPTNPDVTTTFNSYEYVHGISFSYPLSDQFYIGSGINFFKSDLATGIVINGGEIQAATGVTFDLGTYYQNSVSVPEFRLIPTFGISLTDFGKPVKYQNSAPSDPLPMILRGGIGIQAETIREIGGLTLLSLGMYSSLSKVMARQEEKLLPGGEIEYEAYGPFKALIGSWDKIRRFNGQGYVELNVWEQFRRHNGFELILMETFSFRFGHFYEDPNNGDRAYATFGFGIQHEFMSFDYSELRTRDESSPLEGTRQYQLSINVPLDKLTEFFQ